MLDMISYAGRANTNWYVDNTKEMKCEEDLSEEILEQLNSFKPDVIVFTRENQIQDALLVLDLKQKVYR
jgi:hypothetical protein